MQGLAAEWACACRACACRACACPGRGATVKHRAARWIPAIGCHLYLSISILYMRCACLAAPSWWAARRTRIVGGKVCIVATRPRACAAPVPLVPLVVPLVPLVPGHVVGRLSICALSRYESVSVGGGKSASDVGAARQASTTATSISWGGGSECGQRCHRVGPAAAGSRRAHAMRIRWSRNPASSSRVVKMGSYWRGRPCGGLGRGRMRVEMGLGLR
jgi:hypothetical protein